MVELPNEGVFLVALQDGQVVVFPAGERADPVEVVLEWRERTRRDGNEEGLLGLALDPGFEQNGFVYVYYTAADGERRSIVSRFGTSGSGTALRVEPSSEFGIIEVPQPYANHNGGHIAFGLDGMLYIGLGDGGSGGDPEGNGQDTGTLLGSILRIDVRGAGGAASYAIPDDNPFAAGGGRPEIWAYGLRNPWRFGFDRETAEVWAGDVGQDRFEEIDVIERGANYGWNVMEGAHCYRPGEGCERAGLSLPVAEYDHGGGRCSVTGGYVYRGTTNPSLRGYYVFGDFCSGEIWVVDAEERGEVIPLIDSGLPVASFAEDADGELYVLSFDGRIYRLVP
jgi:glucose/arabinose dehydrogenase